MRSFLKKVSVLYHSSLDGEESSLGMFINIFHLPHDRIFKPLQKLQVLLLTKHLESSHTFPVHD